ASAQVALTLSSLDRSAVHELLAPVHAPPQPLKTPPESGVSTTVRTEPAGTVHEQVEPALPQSIWLLPPVSVPLPVNVVESVRLLVGGPAKTAVIVWSSPSVMSQGPEVLSQGPSLPAVRSQSFQWSNVQPFAVSFAVSVAVPPRLSAHVFLPSPHLIPFGLVTCPLPTTLTALRPVAVGGGGG